MKKCILLFLLFIHAVAFSQSLDIEGEWTPDKDSWLGEIRIKHMGGDKYKLRLQTKDGVETISATFKNGVLSGNFETEEPSYGKFWVERRVTRGHENEYEIRKSTGSYNTCNGLASGELNGNWDYEQTNSRSNCATVLKFLCCLDFKFKGDNMTVVFSLRGVYLKNGYPMFYQEWVKGVEPYSRW